MLERTAAQVEGEVDLEGLLGSVSGIGPTLARQIYPSLGISSRRDLEMAAHRSRLARLMGSGPRTSAETGQGLVIICYKQGGVAGRSTVVSDLTGPMRGSRVVRDREVECLRFYGIGPPTPSTERGRQPPPPPA